MEVYETCFASLHNWLKKLQPDFKTNNNQDHQKIELWKSNNQGFKEAIFIQSGQRGRDVEMGGEAWRHDVVWTEGEMGGPTFTCGD